MSALYSTVDTLKKATKFDGPYTKFKGLNKNLKLIKTQKFLIVKIFQGPFPKMIKKSLQFVCFSSRETSLFECKKLKCASSVLYRTRATKA